MATSFSRPRAVRTMEASSTTAMVISSYPRRHLMRPGTFSTIATETSSFRPERGTTGGREQARQEEGEERTEDGGRYLDRSRECGSGHHGGGTEAQGRAGAHGKDD